MHLPLSAVAMVDLHEIVCGGVQNQAGQFGCGLTAGVISSWLFPLPTVRCTVTSSWNWVPWSTVNPRSSFGFGLGLDLY